jgi:LytS/YehU family sensor histidine kinase
MYAFIIGIVNIICFNTLYRYFSWEKQAKILVVIGIIGSVLWSTVAFFIARIFHIVVIEGVDWETFIAQEWAGTYLFSLMIAFIITLAFHAFYFYKNLQQSKIKEQEYLAKSNQAQLDALKTQLDPPFLFNSLNVLSALIDEKPDKAQQFTIKLANIYRYVLDSRMKDLTDLADELKFADDYVQLLKMRFENSVQFELGEKLNQLDAQLIPLSIQLLLENAVKHNQINEDHSLYISIQREADHLRVCNNKNPLNKTLVNREGIGLDNIKKRYQRFTDLQVIIDETENHFCVYLPLLQINDAS